MKKLCVVALALVCAASQVGGQASIGTGASGSETFFGSAGYVWFNRGPNDLTAATPTAFVAIAPTSTLGAQGGVLFYCVEAGDGTDYQARCGSVPVVAIAKTALLFYCVLGTPVDTCASSKGASHTCQSGEGDALTVSFTAAANTATLTCDVSAEAASGLTETSLRLNFGMWESGQTGTALTQIVP